MTTPARKSFAIGLVTCLLGVGLARIVAQAPDAFEPDDTSGQASVIAVGASQARTLHVPGDVDWIRFTGTSGVPLTLSTSNLGTNVDTYLDLFASDGTTNLGSNDDVNFPSDLSSSIQFTPGTTGNYYARVRLFDQVNGPAGSYTFNLVGTGPGAFNKTSPASGSTGNPTNVTLVWSASSGASSYEYCIDTTNDNACSGWTSTGTTTSANIGGLSNNTTYYWHVRANSGGGTTYSNGSATAFWSFAVGSGGAAEIRIQPTTLTFTPATLRPIFVEIDWMDDVNHSHKPSQAVIDAIVAAFARDGYAITLDVSNAIPHQNVLQVTNSPSASADIQAIKAAHFNHAGDSRYFYSIWGHLYSYNGGATGSSGIADLPGSTHLVTLGNFPGQVGTQSHQIGTFIHEFGHNLNQFHGGADHNNYKPNYISVMNYHYQLDGLGPALLALQYANTSSGFNSFGYSHGMLPSLNESALNENFGIGLGRAVDWNCNGTIEASVAKDIQNSSHCSASGGLSTIGDFDNWTGINGNIQTGALVPPKHDPASKSVQCITADEHAPLGALIESMRAAGTMPSEAEFLAEATAMSSQGAFAGQFFEVFNDGGATLTISNIALDVSAPWLTWEPKTFSVPPGGSQRVYVYNNYISMPAFANQRGLVISSNDSDEPTSVVIVNTGTGSSLPGAFSKTAPANGSSGHPSSVQLTWGASSGAGSYEVCVDTTNDNACSGWTNAGAATNFNLGGLAQNTTYYWHVRANGPGGTTYSNGGATAFWSFTTAATAPGAFSKTAPANGATGQPSNVTLSWGAAAGAGSYEFCIDSSNDNACSGWTNAGTATSANVGGLAPNVTYYWHARANSAGGTTYSNGSATAFWSFSTQADADSDSVPDATDQCPYEPGPGPSGCPGPPPASDVDGDGLPNASDSCSSVYAKTPNGCPVLPLRAGDLSGDGWPDVLFQDTNRLLYTWWIQNGNYLGAAFLNPGVAPSVNDWIIGKGDFNEDGQMDLMWQNQVSGVVTIWFMQGPRRLGAPVAVMSSPDWRVVATPDLNLDGYPDVLWQRPTDGALYYYLMDFQGGNIVITGAGPIVNFGGQAVGSGGDWTVVATGDLNGDNRPDLVFQRNSGLREVRAWYLGGPAGATVTNAGILLHSGPGDWRVRMMSDLNGDNIPDLVWQHSTMTIALYRWYLNGAGGAPTSEGYLLPAAPVPPQWRVVGGK
jgi:hypothetical protein